ncbi:MAG: cupin domain-containing protein [Lachnospiraceae bacterium]|nr:cupin domain-containing protein [Lachnospiraceae bacterium]
MNSDYRMGMADYGPNPYVANLNRMVRQNPYFRAAVWTGEYLQTTLMSIPVQGEIGLELHEDTDQMLRVEQGMGLVMMGAGKDNLDFRQRVMMNDVIFVPAGIWHNIVNIGRGPLRITSTYAPPHHPRGTVHRTRREAELLTPHHENEKH